MRFTRRAALGVIVSCALAMLPTVVAAETPRIGILLPVGPRDYQTVMARVRDPVARRFGPFDYTAGTIDGVPVVVGIAPIDGPLMRSLSAQEMLQHYAIKAFVYPGTSGAHLGPERMRAGDIVLGAANVDFGNFFMAKSGALERDEFGNDPVSLSHYRTLYLDPKLLAPLACAASRVAAHVTLPPWFEGHHPPVIFYYGVQGTSTMWLANRAFIAKIVDVFHAIDEDGDWYSNLLATIYHVPFIEVSTISDSILQFPATERGAPTPPAGAGPGAGIIAQRISDAIVVDLIARDGRRILTATYATPVTNPFPAAAFDRPTDPRGLLADCRH
jgi:adenosylhomocysteine nucleosidase